jgi:hypothetical protein
MMAVLMTSIIITVLGVGIVAAILHRGPLSIPQVSTFVQTRLNKQLTDQSISVGSFALMSGADGVGNMIRLLDVSIFDQLGKELLVVPEMRTKFSLLELLKGNVAPDRISIIGSALSLERDENGMISMFGNGAELGAGPNILAILDGLSQTQVLRSLEHIDLTNVTVMYNDLLAGQSWILDDSKLSITRKDDVFSGRAELALAESTSAQETKLKMVLNADYKVGAETSDVSFQFSNANPTEIADLFQAFDWLRNLETRLSGSVRATLGRSGALGNLHGVMEMAEGRISETPASQPITFSTAKVYFEYDPNADVLNMQQVQLETSSGTLMASGYSEFERNSSGRAVAAFGQLRLSDVKIIRPDLFDLPIDIGEAALDARVSFDPLTFEVGRMTVFDQGSTIKVKGRSIAGKTHWKNNYDVDIDQISLQRLKQLWPKPLVSKTRSWVSDNIHSGLITDFAGGGRSHLGKFEYAFNFGVRNANFQFLDTMPALQQGQGFGYLTQDNLRLDLSSGFVVAPDQTHVDVAGTSLFIPNIRTEYARGEITLHAKGGVTAALGLLNVEKFQFIDKAGLKPDVAEGSAVVAGMLDVPFYRSDNPTDLKMDLSADLLNVRSTTLVKGHLLTSPNLKVKVTEKGIILAGDAAFDQVPMNATWSQKFGADAPKSSRFVARVPLSDKNLRALRIILPARFISGETEGVLEIELAKAKSPDFTLSSALIGATLRIPELGWTKAASTQGRLLITGTLGETPDVKKLELKAPGFEVEGKLDLNSNGSLQQARFTKIKVGKWLDTSATLSPNGAGGSNITVNGGNADLRELGKSAQGNGGADASSTIKISLDRVRITDDLSLTTFVGQLTTKGGLNGKFVGKVNNGTRIDGKVFQQKYGTAFELVSDNAGGVMASAKLLENVRGGDMRVILIPQQGKGDFNGTLDVKRTRIKDASALAGLLNAISLVGLIQQLEGEGIHFSTVEGRFKLRENGVKLEKISAVGPSMGMTLNGWYDVRNKVVDFEGVTTPFYAVNGIFERLLGPLIGRQKGEGIFSFTYRMRGSAAKPKITVNPLSILTPGAFREIFRTKVPDPPIQ